MLEKLARAVFIILVIFICYVLSIFLHELGHFCLGKATGYSMVSFRIGSFKLCRIDGKWKIVREKIMGTQGQCIMDPPETDAPEKAPMIWYHLGGGLFNLLTVMVSLPFALLAEGRYVKIFFWMLMALSLGEALLNLLPANVKLPNDGMNARLALKYPSDRAAMYHVLKIHAATEEHSPGEMPEAWFEASEEGEYSGAMKVIRGVWCMDRGELEKAEDLFDAAVKEVNGYYRLEAAKELLFCRLLRNAPLEDISSVYTDELKKYIEVGRKSAAGCMRVSYAWKALLDKSAEAEKEYQMAKALHKNLLAGDAKLEERLLTLVRERANAL